MHRDHSRGITLVELLVSVGIVGTLVLMLLPAIQSCAGRGPTGELREPSEAAWAGLAQLPFGQRLFPHEPVPGARATASGIPCSRPSCPTWNRPRSTTLTISASRTGTKPIRRRFRAGWRHFSALTTPGLRTSRPARFGIPRVVRPSPWAHFGANWGGGRGLWGEEFVKQRGTYQGVMMTVINADGREKRPTASRGPGSFESRTSSTARPTPWRWSRNETASAGRSAAGAAASSTFTLSPATRARIRWPEGLYRSRPRGRAERSPVRWLGAVARTQDRSGRLVRPDHPGRQRRHGRRMARQGSR